MGRNRSAERRATRAYRALAPAVLGYFRSHRVADPEALTGDVFVAVAAGIDRFEGDDAALRRWVFTIAHHRRVDVIRRANIVAIEVCEDLPEASIEDPTPFDPALVDALGALTADQREVVTLRFVADLSVAEVAELTGRSAGSVKMLTSRALATLAGALDPGADDAEISTHDRVT